MSMTYKRKGVRYQEVWFDEPVCAGLDIVIGRQRASCPVGFKGDSFHTITIDLTQTQDQISAAIDKDTRYEIRRAEKSDHLSFQFFNQPLEYLEEFCSFYNDFASAKGLQQIGLARLAQMTNAGHFVLSRVIADQRPLVWHAYYCVAGRARLLYSASQFRGKDSGLRSLIGRANRYLHWRDILEFKMAGYRIYDLGGWNPDGAGDVEKQRINSFKEAFGGHRVVEYNFTYPTSTKGRLAMLFKAAKSKLFNLKSHRLGNPDAKKPHLCIVAADIWPILADDRRYSIAGGLEVQLSILARAFVSAGFKVSVVTQNFGQPDGVTLDGVTVYRAHSPNEGLPVVRFFHPRISSWWAAMKRADADVYIQRSASYLTAIVGLFSKWHGRSFIYSGAHDLDYKRDETWKLFQRRMGWRDRRLFEWGLCLADGVVAQHKGQVEACQLWYGRSAVEIPNCYARPSDGGPKADGVILWVATIKSWKRPELFLELARMLPHLRFRMIGGPGKGEEGRFIEVAKQATTALSNVEFVGFVPYAQVGSHFDEARLFVNTSDYEGFPNTFLQAWARGVPTVSFFDCGAQESGRSVGYLCSDLADMSRIVARLAEDDVEWQEESQRVHGYFESNHSVDAAVTRYTALIQQVRDTRGRSKWNS